MLLHKHDRLKEKSQSCWLFTGKYLWLFMLTSFFLLESSTVMAQNQNNNAFAVIDTIWMVVAGALVFFMNAGFALLEAGLCRQKNFINILSKNLIVFCISMIAFWSIGFGLMFGNGHRLWGEEGFFFESFKILNQYPNSFSMLGADYPQHAFAAVFFFQLVFAGTSATIVSGAVDERVKFSAFSLFSFLLVGVSYAITGHWAWSSEGWLRKEWFFVDFAGSTVVHSVGGTAGLVGAWLLGPRLGRFPKIKIREIEKKLEETYNNKEWSKYDRYFKLYNKYQKRQKSFNPNSNPVGFGFATLGCLILWLGWIGFNGGSVGSNLNDMPHVVVTTMMAGCMGGISALIFSKAFFKKPSLASIINGILGGLVAITASSAFVSILGAIIIGGFSGFFVLLLESWLEIAKIDDPVGAVPVHLGCGLWGTLAVGIFANPDTLNRYLPETFDPSKFNNGIQIVTQFIGWGAICVTTAFLSLIFWMVVGAILIKLSPSKKMRVYNYQNLGLGEKLWQFLVESRKAIRVSRRNEYHGFDDYFSEL